MIELLNDYITAFLHPFKNQLGFRQLRQRGHELAGTLPLRLADDDVPTQSELEDHISLKFLDMLGVSWIFIAIEGFYAVLALHLGQMFFQSWTSPEEIALLLPIDTTLYTQRALLTATLAKVAFFPIIFWFYATFWKVLIKFFANLFQVEGNIPRITDQIVHQSLSAHLMLAIPVFGKMLRHLLGLVHIFAGLRENMRMTVLQSLVVILSPAIMLTMISAFFMVVLLYLIGLLF